jgi:hypothetical protein
MGSTVQLAGLIGVSSPPLTAQLSGGARKQVCCSPSLRAPRQQSRRRLRVARAVEVGAPGGAAGAPEEKVEEPSVDFAFVSVSHYSLGPRLSEARLANY